MHRLTPQPTGCSAATLPDATVPRPVVSSVCPRVLPTPSHRTPTHAVVAGEWTDRDTSGRLRGILDATFLSAPARHALAALVE